jgi:hypothetical protein
MAVRDAANKHDRRGQKASYQNHPKGEAPMELTCENVMKWFGGYFEDVCRNQGDLETVPKLGKYFTSDFELMMYTAPSPPPTKPMSRDALLMSFVHPGLHEEIVPRCYVVDVKQMIVVVQFEIHFSDKPSGKNWPALQASAHYHLSADENKELKIRRIHYWTEALPGDIFEYWTKRRDEALQKHAISYINGSP